ncbi:MAG: TIGR01212 family radical SAM protein [Lachnospiraceae bacterium]|nr:TIGR01212 family radical SAM protein [Lachnospiraceae bacterium]
MRQDWNGKPYYSLDYYLKQTFGKKVYKLALDGGMTCPNRDGTVGTGGCIFCSAGGSGDFAAGRTASVKQQVEEAKACVAKKMKQAPSADAAPASETGSYIAYFQSYTNTYAPLPYLTSLFTEAISLPDICALSVATRPDCLPDETIALLASLNRIKPVWVELGLQTIHEKTADFIRRGYPLPVFEDAYRRLKQAGLTVIVHVILGLPGETTDDMLATVRYLARLSVDGIKLQLLHVLKGTDLDILYREGAFRTLESEEYLELIGRCLCLLPPETVIHRLSGDGPKSILTAPLWSGNKRMVLNSLSRYLREHEIWQGKFYFPADKFTSPQ